MTGFEILGAIGIGASIFGGISDRKASREQARQTEEQAAFQAAIARENAAFELALGERNAQAAIQQAAAEEARLRRDRDRRVASTRTRFAASGVQLEGSALEVIGDQVMADEEDALLVRYSGEVAAQQARLAGEILARREQQIALGVETTGQFRAESLRAQGTASLIGGFAQAAGTALLLAE